VNMRKEFKEKYDNKLKKHEAELHKRLKQLLS